MNKKLFALALLPALGLMTLGATAAYAHAGEGLERGPDGPGGHGMHRGMGENSLVPEDMREAFRADRPDFAALSDEEREALREDRRAMHEERRAEFEEFSGLTHEETRELRHNGESIGDALNANGVTEEDAEEFLTERANERVDDMVERHDLDAEEEQTLRDRIADFVSAMLAKWFPEA